MSDAAAFDALTAKVNELAQLCRELSQENAELRSQFSQLSADDARVGEQSSYPIVNTAAEVSEPGKISRRTVGVALAGAAAGIVGAATLGDFGSRHNASSGASSSAAPVAAEELAFTEAEQHRAHAAGPNAGSVIEASLATSAAVVGVANTSGGPGVQATSRGGRGGVFAGAAAAQIQLSPGRATHPRGGQRGDLYADSSGRLWFCKKSGARATWHQIA
jgi:hypothetical protein